MLYWHTFLSRLMVDAVMLPACILGIGFMVRFVIALRAENTNGYSAHSLHPGGEDSEAADLACFAVPARKPRSSSATSVAIGVVRITTAPASNTEKWNSGRAIGHPKVVTLNMPGSGRSIRDERRCRSG